MKSVLVIEDCIEVAETIAAILADGGYEPVLTPDVHEAMRMCITRPFSVVICDLSLPVGEHPESVIVGMQTVRDLKASFPTLPVVAMSGAMRGSSLRHMSDIGASAILGKPFTRTQLLEIVETVVSQGGEGT